MALVKTIGEQRRNEFNFNTDSMATFQINSVMTEANEQKKWVYSTSVFLLGLVCKYDVI